MLLTWLSYAALAPRPASSHMLRVRPPFTQAFRADARPPQKVKARGGFLTVNLDLTHPSLYDHSVHVDCISSATNCRRDVVFIHATHRAATEEAFLDQGPGYIYYIQPTPNFIDVAASLGVYSRFDESKRRDFAVIGDVRWDQIIGWQHLPFGHNTLERERVFTMNVDFEQRLGSWHTPAAHPELAGFPESHNARKESPWKDFDGQLQTYARRIINETQSALQWASIFEPTAAKLTRRVTSAVDDAKLASRQARDTDDATSSGYAARKAERAAETAMRRTKDTARFIESSEWSDVQLFARAWLGAFAAREKSLLASQEAAKRQADECEAAIDRALDHALSLAKPLFLETIEGIRASSSATLLTEMGEQVTFEVETKTALRIALEAGLFTDREAVIWIPSRETFQQAVEREVEMLKMEVNILNQTASLLLTRGARAKANANKAVSLSLFKVKNSPPEEQAQVNTALVQQLIGEGAREDSTLHKTREIVRLIYDMGSFLISMVPNPALAPLQAVVWGQRGYRLYLWLQRISKASKVVGASVKAYQLTTKIVDMEVRTEHRLKSRDAPAALFRAGGVALDATAPRTMYNLFEALDSGQGAFEGPSGSSQSSSIRARRDAVEVNEALKRRLRDFKRSDDLKVRARLVDETLHILETETGIASSRTATFERFVDGVKSGRIIIREKLGLDSDE